jgi:putative flippase GtrA
MIGAALVDRGHSRSDVSERQFAELPKFVGVGAIGFAVDASVLTALVVGWGQDPYRARGVSFALAVTLTWYLNRCWAFVPRANQRKATEYARYLAVQLTGAIINLSVYTACLNISTVMRSYPVLPLAIGAAIALAFNYLGAKYVVFTGRVV